MSENRAPIIQHCTACKVALALVDPSWRWVKFTMPSTFTAQIAHVQHGSGARFSYSVWHIESTYARRDCCSRCKKPLTDGPPTLEGVLDV